MKQVTRQSFYIFLQSFLMASVLSSCAWFEKKSVDDYYSSTAPFIVGEVTKSQNATRSITVIRERNLAHKFIVSLSTCLKDSIRQDVPIQGVPFSIEYYNNDKTKKKKIIQVTTDTDGCMSWDEEYPYRYIIKPTWIVLDRTIKAKSGSYAGQEKVSLAINPWLSAKDSEFPPVLDLRKTYSGQHNIFKQHPYKKEGLKFLQEDQYNQYPQLWAHRVDIQIEKTTQTKPLFDSERQDINVLLDQYKMACDKDTDKDSDCYHREFKLNLTIPLQARTYSLGGDLVDSSISGGKYKVQFQLLASPHVNQKNYRIHHSDCSKEVAISDTQDNAKLQTKFISLECDISISYFNPNATHTLALVIEPANSKLPFKKFEGLYTIDLAQAIDSAAVTTYSINSDLDQKYSNLFKANPIFSNQEIKSIYEAQLEGENQESASHDLGFRSVFIDVTLEDIKFSDIVNNKECFNNESVVKRKVRFIGRACLNDPFTSKPYNKTKFQIFVEDLNTGEKKEVFIADDDSKNSPSILDKILQTKDDGCISWVDTLEHNIFDVQVYTPKRVHFVSRSLNLYGSFDYSVNPWQRAFQAAQDTDQLGKNAARISPEGVPKPKLIINQFKSINLFPSYVLDNFLNLHIFQNLYFLFQPFITRHDDVSLGRDHKARALIRDGYYIVRILLARNPQETGDLSRVTTQAKHEKTLNNVNNNTNEFTQLDNAEYLTHIDTILKTEANFINLYMPLSFSKDQMLYLASRNLLSIEVVPTDPSYYKFKSVKKGDQNTCELDLENTKWIPYFKHDLINHPYIGVFNAQHWTNWNVLKQSPNLNTDVIISRNEEGKRYQHFKLHDNSNGETLNSKKLTMISGQSGECSGAQDGKKDSGCVVSESSQIASKITQELTSQVQQRAEDQVSKTMPYKQKKQDAAHLIESFATQNSLKAVFLEDSNQQQNLIEDINNSYRKMQEIQNRATFTQRELFLIKDEKLKENIQEALKKCSGWSFSSSKRACVDQAFQVELAKFFKLMDQETKGRDFNDFMSINSNDSAKKQTINNLKSFFQDNPRVGIPLEIDKDFLLDVVDKGMIHQNQEQVDNLKLGRAMCGFWFDSFFDKYLDAKQVKSAYSNFISQYDYYTVLEKDYSFGDGYHEKQNFLQDFLNIVPESDQELKACHQEYANCVVIDHCKLREHTAQKQYSYCKKASTIEDASCKRVVEEECSENSKSPLCRQNITNKNCHSSLDNFCNSNSDYAVCKKYYGRCLKNYNSCAGSKGDKTFSNYKPFDFYKDLTKSNKYIKPPQSNGKNSNGKFKKPFDYLLSQIVCTSPGATLGNQHCFDGPAVNRFAMMESCLANPFDFFEFHNKMFVEKISDKNPVYVGGLATTFTVSANISTGSYMNWTSQFGSSVSVKTGGSISPSLPSIFSITLADFSLSKSVSSNISNSGRRAIDVRVGEGAFMLTSKATIDVEVDKYQKCLVIKPKPHAFLGKLNEGKLKPYKNSQHLWSKDFPNYKKALTSRLGMMICNPKEDKNPETIRENYYFISQVTENSSSQFLNLYDIINRPFAAFIRGKKEFYNFFNMTRSIMEGDGGNLSQNAQVNTPPYNMFYDYPHPIEEATSLNLTLREFGLSGFYPGVYDYGKGGTELDARFKKNKDNFFQGAWKVFEGLTPDSTLLPQPPGTNQIPVQQKTNP